MCWTVFFNVLLTRLGVTGKTGQSHASIKVGGLIVQNVRKFEMTDFRPITAY